MKKPEKLVNIYWPRAILYFATIIICAVLLYLYLFVTPQLKQDSLRSLIFLYERGEYAEAVTNCRQMIVRFPQEAVWPLWLGKCCDGLHKDLEDKTSLQRRYLEKAKSAFYTDRQKQELLKGAETIAVYLKKWQLTNWAQEAATSYQTAYQLAPTWEIGSKIVEAHLMARRAKDASLVLEKLARPAAPEQAVYCQLLEAELLAHQAEAKEVALDIFAAKCNLAIDAYSKLEEPHQKNDLLRQKISQTYAYLAKIAEQTGKTDQINEFYEKAIRFTTQNAHLYLGWSKTLQKLARYAKAEEILLQAVAQYSDFPELQYELANTSLALWNMIPALRALEKTLYSNRKDNESFLEQELTTSPLWARCQTNPDFNMLMGWHYQAPIETQQNLRNAIHFAWKRRLDEAIERAKAVTNVDQNSYPAYLIWLYCRLGQKSHKLAWERKLATETAQLAQKDLAIEDKIFIERELAKTKAQIKKTKVDGLDLKICDQEITQCLEKIRAHSSDIAIELAIAHCYLSFQFYQEALANLANVMDKIEEKQLKALAYCMQGFCYQEILDLPKATEQFAHATELWPQSPVYHLWYADALKRHGQLEAALAQYLQVVQLVSGNPNFHYETGKLFFACQKYSQAREQFQTAIELRPSLFMGRYQIAKTFLLEDKLDAALQMLEKTLQDRGDNQKLLQMLQEEAEWKKLYNHPEFRRILKSYPY